MPFSWGMFVYSEETLRVNKRQLGGSLGNLFIYEVMMSWIYDGSWVTLDRRKKLAKREEQEPPKNWPMPADPGGIKEELVRF